MVAALLFLIAAQSAEPQAPTPPAPEAATAAPETAPPAAAPPESTPPAAPPAGAAPDAAPPAGAAPAAAPTAPGPGDPTEVDGWTLISFTSERRLPDGRPTEERCGFERDVVVERLLGAPAAPEKVMKRAVLQVPCDKDAAGALVPGKPSLVFPGEPKKRDEAPAADAGAATASGDAPAAAPAEEAPAAPRPCAQGEKPLPKAKLGPGQQACVETESDRGVPFLKGELTRFGDVQITNTRSSFGVGIGAAALDDALFLQLRPDLNVHWGQFKLGLGAPLRFEILDLSGLSLNDPSSANGVFAETGRFRTEDWDQLEDFLRPLRYITWGKKEDRLYVDMNRVHPVTLGHGQLVRRYNPNLDIDEDNLMAAVDGYTDVGGVELIAGPFPVPRLVGGLFFIKPLGGFVEDNNVLGKSWSVGFTWVSDLNAPTALDKRAHPADGRTQLAVDSSGQFQWAGRNNPVGDLVQGVGLDTELKVLKYDAIDLKVYGDWSQLVFPTDSSAEQAFTSFSAGGGTVGGLLRMSFGETPVRPISQENEEVKAGRAPREMKAAHAVRVRLEGRAFDPRYLPSYFNTMYEVDRLQYGVAEHNQRAALPAKIGFLAAQEGEPWRLGAYLEASYLWVDAVGATVVYEEALPLGATSEPVHGRNLAIHLETDGGGFLQLFASYHYRNFESFDGLFSFNTDNEILYGGGRIELLPFLFINAGVQRTFRLGFDDDDVTRTADARGNRYSTIGLENVWAGSFDVELGWQF